MLSCKLSYRSLGLASVLLILLPAQIFGQNPTIRDPQISTVTVWDVLSGTRLFDLNEVNPSTQAVFSPDGRTLAVSTQSGHIDFWDLTSRQLQRTLLAAPVLAMSFSADGKLFVAAGSSGIELWDLPDGKLQASISPPAGRVSAATISANSHVAAVATEDNSIFIFDLSLDRLVGKLNSISEEGSRFPISALAFSPRGTELASGGVDHLVRVWDIKTGELIATLAGHTGVVTTVAFDDAGTTVASGSADHTVRVWDLHTATLLYEFSEHRYPVTSVAFLQKSRSLVSSSQDHTLKVWSPFTESQHTRFDLPGQVTSLAVSHDGRFLAGTTNLETFAQSAAANRGTVKGSTLFILAVGIDRYLEPTQRLEFSANDARAVAETIDKFAKGTFERVEKNVLVNESATRIAISKAFQSFANEARPTDTFVFYFSGFAAEATSKKNGRYLLPFDARGLASRDPEDLELTGLSSQLFNTWIAKMPAKQQLILIDTCGSAGFFESLHARLNSDDPALQELLDRKITAIGYEGVALESPSLGHGILTYAFLNGLSNAQLSDNDEISVRNVARYTTEHLPSAPVQTRAVTFSIGSDFNLGIRTQGQPSSVLRLQKQAERNMLQVSLRTSESLTASPRQPQSLRSSPDIQTPIGSGSPNSSVRNDYALLFATKNYREWSQLANPIQDANDIADALSTLYGFKTEVVQDPTQQTILLKIREYLRKAYGDKDQLLIFFAGHGDYDELENEGYIVAANSAKDDESKLTYISHSHLRTIVDNVPAKHVLLVLDVCYGGAFDPTAKEARNRGGDIYAHVSRDQFIDRKLKYETRRYVSAGGKEYVVSDGLPGHHSPFSRGLLEALRSGGGPDGILTLSVVMGFMERVQPEPRQSQFGRDEPGSDFLFIQPTGAATATNGP